MMSGSQRGSVMGDRRQSEVGSMVSFVTANTTASRLPLLLSAPPVLHPICSLRISLSSQSTGVQQFHAQLILYGSMSCMHTCTLRDTAQCIPGGCQVVLCTCRSSEPIEVQLPTEYLKVIDQLGTAREKTLQVCLITIALARPCCD